MRKRYFGYRTINGLTSAVKHFTWAALGDAICTVVLLVIACIKLDTDATVSAIGFALAGVMFAGVIILIGRICYYAKKRKRILSSLSDEQLRNLHELGDVDYDEFETNEEEIDDEEEYE